MGLLHIVYSPMIGANEVKYSHTIDCGYQYIGTYCHNVIVGIMGMSCCMRSQAYHVALLN